MAIRLLPTMLAGGVLAAALLGVAWLVRRSVPLLLAWAAGAGALLLFAYTKFPGAMRHNGFLWVWGVAVLWLAVSSGVVTRRAATLVLAPSLLAGLVGAGIAATWDLRAPFSAAEEVARELRGRDLLALPLVGGVDFATSGVTAFAPERQVVLPGDRSRGTFVVWNLARLHQNDLADADLVEAARLHDRGQGAILLTNSALPAETRRRLHGALRGGADDRPRRVAVGLPLRCGHGASAVNGRDVCRRCSVRPCAFPGVYAFAPQKSPSA